MLIRRPELPDTEAQMQGTKVAEKPYLAVVRAFAPSRTVQYCSAVDPAFKNHLLGRLVRVAKRESNRCARV